MTIPASLELLAPAKNVQIGREAILHGADAVYIGGPAFGARAHADNTVQEIESLVSFAHQYRARIFVTLNTILHDAELAPAQRLIHQLYDAGVDALIVQDMGLLEMELPPIALHASTQCDIRTPQKARFLQDVGFSQMVLARELSLEEIGQIAASTTSATLEYFIHGALCVAFSGQCYISHAHTGRSANRGDCSQACRLPYTLNDANGRVVAYDKHLLSLKDNDQSANLRALIDAGIRSFKIEGRYKEENYVKNITAHYRRLIDQVLTERPELARASSGKCEFFFEPNPEKTFHRGATDYFVNGRREDIGAFESPKFVGLPIGTVTQIGKGWFDMESNAPMANGDGLNFMRKREVVGIKVNLAQRNGHLWRITPNEASGGLEGLQIGSQIHRNLDHAWEQALTKKSSDRRIDLWMQLTENAQGLCLTLTDEDGVTVQNALPMPLEVSQNGDKALASLREGLGKMGNTLYRVQEIALSISQPWFVPASQINNLRRQAVQALEAAREASFKRPERAAPVSPDAPYPEESLSYLANVYNSRARAFYEKHGVKVIDAAYEAHKEPGEVSLMITKHCLRFSFNLCPKQAKGVQGVQGQVRAEPMTLVNGSEHLTLKFDCRACEMHVVGSAKKRILQQPLAGSVPIELVKLSK